MKILITALLISIIGLFTNYNAQQPNFNVISKCNCAGFFGSCSISCETTSNCNCILTSNCACDSESYQILPTQNKIQYENSVVTQQYFKEKNTKSSEIIATCLESLRMAIENDDLETYSQQATLLDNTFNDLSEMDKNTFLTWAIENLVSEND